jgi:hypothetical protein
MEGILFFGSVFVGVIAFSPIGRAFADRMRHGRASGATLEELEDLRQRVQQLQEQVSELAERQDFAERMLAQSRDRAALAPGQGGA